MATTKPRYILHPGMVTSRTDGQRHYVGVGPLWRLYGLRPSDNVVIHYPDRLYFPLPEPGDIHLRPRYNGDYKRVHDGDD